MVPNSKPKIKCFLIVPFDEEYRLIRNAMRKALRGVGGQLISSEDRVHVGELWQEIVSSQIDKSDLVVAELSQPKPNILYEIGLAHAMGKPTVFVVDKKIHELPSTFQGFQFLTYTKTPAGLHDFQHRLRRWLEDFSRYPRRFRSLLPFAARFAPPSFIIDLEKLAPREFENLCFELLAQMGFRRPEWGEALRGIDAVATLPKKDPDGYEYHELWLISMGRREPVEVTLDMITHDPEFFFRRILEHPDAMEEISSKFRPDTPITLLLIIKGGKGSVAEFLEHEQLTLIERRSKSRRHPFTFRVRLWDPLYLTNLVRQYPQIGHKYFSDEGRAKSKYRKTQEELYMENVRLTEGLQVAFEQLEEEKKKRFIAERDAAWKDVAFKAAHKLGNPIDAVETYLQSLKVRIGNKRSDGAIQIVEDMGISIEEAKAVIAQFKSLAKSQEINPRSTELSPLIEHACEIAKENGVKVQTHMIEDCPPAMVDEDRISECFNELVANSLHWFNKDKKMIRVSVDKISKRELPDRIDSTREYLKVRFEDNGCGIPLKNKEKILAPFYTTDPHGAGLGLSIVKTIIEGHGGIIYENGKPGEGTCFEILLPVAKKKRKR